MTQLSGVPVTLEVQRARAGDGATTTSLRRAARWRVITTLNRRRRPIVKVKVPRPWLLRGRLRSSSGAATRWGHAPAGSVHRGDPRQHRRVDGCEQLVVAEEVVQEAAHHAELAPVLLERCTLGSELGRRELALAPTRVRKLAERQLPVEARAAQRGPARVVHEVGEDGGRGREDAAGLELAQRL